MSINLILLPKQELLMIAASIPKTSHKYLQQLAFKTQQIGQNTKRSHSTRLPNQKSLTKNKITRFQLDEVWHRQKYKTLIFNNRLNYIKTQRQKQNRTLELARIKYERLRETRAWSTRNKNNFHKIIELNQLQVERETSQNVARIKEERLKTTMSVSRVKQINEQEAKQLRRQHLENQNHIRQARILEKETKRKMANKIHQEHERSKLRLKQMYKERVLAGKSKHSEYLQRHLELNQKEKKKNSFLRLKLQESLATAEQKKEDVNTIKYNSLLTPSPIQGIKATLLKQT